MFSLWTDPHGAVFCADLPMVFGADGSAGLAMPRLPAGSRAVRGDVPVLPAECDDDHDDQRGGDDMTDVRELIERLRENKPLIHGEDLDAAADALEAQAREIERLEIERDNAIAAALQNKELVEWNRARLAAAERDAERYRWLRVDPSLVVGPSYVLRRTDELDAAIDAAREGK